MNKSFSVSFLLLLLITLTTSCLSPRQEQGKAAFFTFTDFYGRTVSIDSIPQRIISLSPSITEMIFMLQAEDKLVGISDFCHYPEATDTMNRVGGLQNINVESLVALRPDVVLIGSIVSKQDVEKMEQAGLKVLILREETKIEGLYNALSVLGNVLNKNELTAEKIQEFQAQLDSVKQSIDTYAEPPTIYYVVGFGEEGDFTAPANSHIDELITMAGGANFGHQLKSWNVSREYLFEVDPDIILIRSEDFDAFCRTKPYVSLSAVKNNKVYPIESGWIDIVSPRNVNAIQYINQIIKKKS